MKLLQMNEPFYTFNDSINYYSVIHFIEYVIISLIPFVKFVHVAILSVSLFFKNILFAFYAILPMAILSIYFLLKDESIYSEKENISIRLVQPNIKQEEKWNKSLREKHFQKLGFVWLYYGFVWF